MSRADICLFLTRIPPRKTAENKTQNGLAKLKIMVSFLIVERYTMDVKGSHVVIKGNASLSISESYPKRSVAIRIMVPNALSQTAGS